MGFKEFFVKPPMVVTEADGSKSLSVTTLHYVFYSKVVDAMIDEVINHNNRIKKKAFEDEVRKIVREELMKIKQAAPAPAPTPKVDQKPAPVKKAARQRKQK